MGNKKIIVLAFAAFVSAFGTYKAFKDLADSMESWEMAWDEEKEEE